MGTKTTEAAVKNVVPMTGLLNISASFSYSYPHAIIAHRTLTLEGEVSEYYWFLVCKALYLFYINLRTFFLF